MGRKNNRASGRRQPLHPRFATTAPRAPKRGGPPPPLERLVVPRGRCFYRSKNGKLRFAAEDAQEALRQAQAKRERMGSTYHEERVYECIDGCGDWHLTSRKEYEDPTKRSQP